MKQIIDGRVYNTETAKFICELRSVTPYQSDHEYYEGDLYQTKLGQFFIAGRGGPNSMFSKPVGQNSRSAGAGIILLEKEWAMQLAERELDPDEYLAAFGYAAEG